MYFKMSQTFKLKKCQGNSILYLISIEEDEE